MTDVRSSKLIANVDAMNARRGRRLTGGKRRRRRDGRDDTSLAECSGEWPKRTTKEYYFLFIIIIIFYENMEHSKCYLNVLIVRDVQ